MVTAVTGSVWNASENFKYYNLADLVSVGADATNAINTVLALGVPLFIPPGQFLIGSITIPDNSVIWGVENKSILKIKDLNNSIGLSVGSNCRLEKFRIDGNKSNQVGAGLSTIQLVNASYTTLSKLVLTNSKGDGLTISGLSTNEIILNALEISGYAENGIRLATGSNISIISPRIYAADPIASGDALAISSNGSIISNVNISDPVLRGAINRGLSLLGNGAKNVTDIMVSGGRISNNGMHGIHLVNTDRVSISGTLTNDNIIDGVRLEGDVQNSRILNVITKNNGQYGVREVTAGTTPNNNGFIYMQSVGNGTNAITKVGASSFIV